ncbi:Tyrosine recombinase XerC [Tenacibaculum sp. 190524A02b]|uniref:Tyrosine recombinase XerC n=2 Tax=Tenacibaculum vairaonense TaxID=3137860 RepID=A0ABM9PK49_9FLAO
MYIQCEIFFVKWGNFKLNRMLIEAFLEYLEVEKKYSKHTVTAYKKDLESFEEFCVKTYEEDSLVGVHYNQIRTWIVNLVEKGVTNRTINRKISSLKTFYNFLQKIEEIKMNPLAKHKSLKVQKKVSVPFTKEEVKAVIDLLNEGDGFEFVRDRLIVELLYATGIRRAELIAIREKDIDLARGVIKVLGKRNKERLIVLLPLVQKSLERYLIEKKNLKEADREYLLVSKKGVKIYETLVYRIINSYFSRVSTKAKKSPHILRHAFATHMLNNGASLNSVKELLGHSSLASTQVYTHNSLEEIKRVFNKTHPRESD